MLRPILHRFTSASLLLITSVFGCQHREINSKTETLIGEVQDFRITILYKKPENSSGAAGAVIGGLLAGGAGAVIGYAVDKEDDVILTDLNSCKIIVRASDGAIIEFFENSSGSYIPASLQACSLQRRGDRIKIRKNFTAYSDGDTSHEYFWLYGASKFDFSKGKILSR